MDAVVNPPKEDEPSYQLFMKVSCFNVTKYFDKQILFALSIKEKNEVLESLKEKAKLVTELLNKIEGVECNTVQGN
jgi:alanine transaminase